MTTNERRNISPSSVARGHAITFDYPGHRGRIYPHDGIVVRKGSDYIEVDGNVAVNGINIELGTEVYHNKKISDLRISA